MTTPNQLLEVINVQTEIAKLGLDLGSVMSLIVERTLALVNADGAVVELAEDGDMVYRATSGIAQPYLGLRLKMESSLSGLCVQTGEILRCDDSDIDPRVDREACRKVGLRSMIVIPLKHKELTVGVLKAMSAQPGKFCDADMKLLGLLSELIGAAMFYATKYDIDALFHKATHDGLTGLANRSLFMDRLRQIIAQSHRDGRSVGILIIDMDGLKQINDTYGHRIGDAAIIELSHRIQSGARSTDTVARLGGDEFAAILTPVDQTCGISLAVERMLGEIEKPFVFEGKHYALHASIGSSQFPDDCDEINQLLEKADQRMYAVKQVHHQTQIRHAP